MGYYNNLLEQCHYPRGRHYNFTSFQKIRGLIHGSLQNDPLIDSIYIEVKIKNNVIGWLIIFFL